MGNPDQIDAEAVLSKAAADEGELHPPVPMMTSHPKTVEGWINLVHDLRDFVLKSSTHRNERNERYVKRLLESIKRHDGEIDGAVKEIEALKGFVEHRRQQLRREGIVVDIDAERYWSVVYHVYGTTDEIGAMKVAESLFVYMKGWENPCE